MMSKTEWTIVGLIFLFLAIASAMLPLASSAVDRRNKNRCKKIGGAMELEQKYVNRAGCFVKYKGQWVNYNMIRVY